jgi:hypothetical protein
MEETPRTSNSQKTDGPSRAIVLSCPACGITTQTEIHRGEIVLPRCTKCRQFHFRVSGAVVGVIAPTQSELDQIQRAKPKTQLMEADSLLREVLAANRQRMGDGSKSDRFCLACVQRAPHKRPGDCECPCHPAWDLVHRQEEESRAA